MQRKKKTAKCHVRKGNDTHKEKGGSNKRNRDFLRLDPYQLIGNQNESILYRLLKTGLRDMQLSADIQILDFTERSFLTRSDTDAIFMERLHAYTQIQDDIVDPYWMKILSKALTDQVGMRFIENGKTYYILPTCVFVTAHNSNNTNADGSAPPQPSPQTPSPTNNANNYHETYKYQHSEDEANKLLDERRREDARAKRMTTDIRFYGFSIQINDGLPIDSVLSSKKRGGEAVDNRTYYRYLQLQQIGKHTDTKLSEDVGGAKLANTSNMQKRVESVVSMIRGQLRKLFENNRTNHVSVEIGDPISSNSAHFNIKYDSTKQMTEYKASAHSGMNKRAFYQQHGADTKQFFDLDKTIDKQMNTDGIKEYLTTRGDLSSQKRIVLRYYHNKQKEQRYIIYSFQVTNAASKLAGDAIHIVTNSLKPHITDPFIRIYALREYSSIFWLNADMPPPSDNRKSEFDPALVSPKLVLPDDDIDESSDEASGTYGTDVATPENDPLTDPTVIEFKALVSSSSILTFLSFLVLSIVKTTAGGSWSMFSSANDTVVTSSDGMYRNTIKSKSFGVRRENPDEVFRFNTSYLFMNLLMSASHQLQCLSYGRSSVKKSWFSGTVSKGRVYNIISGVDTLQGAGNGLFHEKPAVFEGNAFTSSFMKVFTGNVSGSSVFAGSSSMKNHRSTQVASHYILENTRLFYKDKLGSLAFHLKERDDPDEFILSLSRHNFWEMYSQRIQLIHGPFYKDIVNYDKQDYFMKHLFYYQLKHVIFPNESSAENHQNESDERLKTRIPTYFTHQPEFSNLVTDAHRTLLTLRSLQFESSTNVAAYNLNLLNQYGKSLTTTSLVNVATARNKTATDDMMEMMKEDDTTELEKRISELMKAYKIQDKMFMIDLQRKNTRLLFHFLHMVENNGMLDTLGNLNVTFHDVKQLKVVLQEALHIKANDAGGNMFGGKSLLSSAFTKGTSSEKIGNRLFSMQPYLTLDPRLIRKINKKNGFRLMLQEWSNHGNLFWNIIDFKQSNSFFASRFEKSQISEFSLYVFLPSHIYLTREIRNILPHLEKNAMGTMDSIIHTHEAFQNADTTKLYEAGGTEGLVRGLIFGIQQELLQTSETNVFIIHLKKKGGDTTYWLIGHWRRQYVLYDLGNNLVTEESGLNRLHVDAAVMGTKQRVDNLLDDEVYQSSENMLDTVRKWRENVESKTEQFTTVKQDVNVRQSVRRKRSSIRNKVDRFEKVNGDGSLAGIKTAPQLTDSIVSKKNKVYDFVKVVQFLAFQNTVVPKQGMSADKLFDTTKPYQNNPMCAVMWLIFRDLYTFLPGMYNHVMMAVNDRVRYCELGMMVHTGGVLPGGFLTPNQEPFALKERGYEYYIGSDEDMSQKNNHDRSYLLFLKQPHKSTDNGRINRRLFFQLVLTNLAQLGQTQEAAASYNETEHAEIKVMSWMAYVADKEVTERVADNKYLVLSTLLNGILATNAIMGSSILRTAFRMVNPSGVISMVSSPIIGIAKMMLPVLWTPAIATFALGATLGVSGTFSALAKTAGLLSDGYQDNAGGGILAGVMGAVKNALFGIGGNVASGVGGAVQSKSSEVMDHLAHYLITNIYMYRVTVRFLHNGNKYVWKLDLGVDRSTDTVLMYHGMQEKDAKMTAYRNIKVDTDTDLQKIREHKHTQKNRRSVKRMSTATARNAHTRREQKRRDRVRKRNRRSHGRYHKQYRY